jgi:hypothetical protein
VGEAVGQLADKGALGVGASRRDKAGRDLHAVRQPLVGDWAEEVDVVPVGG